MCQAHKIMSFSCFDAYTTIINKLICVHFCLQDVGVGVYRNQRLCPGGWRPRMCSLPQQKSDMGKSYLILNHSQHYLRGNAILWKNFLFKWILIKTLPVFHLNMALSLLTMSLTYALWILCKYGLIIFFVSSKCKVFFRICLINKTV